MSHQTELAEDVRLSAHNWITDRQSTCAFTSLSRNAEVTFSFETCRPNIRDVNDAIQTLVHESTHHFGIAEEVFADQVGVAIENLGTNCSCQPVPSEDPFDPNSCPGRTLTESELMQMIPLPQSTMRMLGRFKTSIRQRTCYGQNLCSAWGPGDDLLMVYDNPGWKIAPHSGYLLVELVSNRPQLSSRTDEVNAFHQWESHSSILEQTSLSGQAYVMLNETELIRPALLSGWITNTCARQSASVSRSTYDGRGNNVTLEAEMVMLSKFSN